MSVAGRWGGRLLLVVGGLGVLSTASAERLRYQDQPVSPYQVPYATDLTRKLENLQGRAETRLRQGDVAGAARELEQALRVDPRARAVALQLGQLYLKLGRLALAQGLAEQILRATPEDVDALRLKAIACQAQGRLTEAAELYQRLLARQPEDESAQAQMALCRAAMGQGALSATQLIQRLEASAAAAGQPSTNAAQGPTLHPQAVEALGQLSAWAFAHGRYAEARTYAQRALQQRPDFPEVHNTLGVLLSLQGRKEEAVQHFTAALQANPHYFDAHKNLALLEASRNNDAQAREHYLAALQIRPQAAELHYYLGFLAMRQRQVETARVHFQQAVQLQPRFAPAYRQLGQALIRLDRLPEAVTCYRQGLAVDPRQPDLLNNLAWILATRPDLKSYDPSEALRLADRLRQAKPQLTVTELDTVAAAYAAAGRYPQAIATLQQALALAGPAAEVQASKLQAHLALLRQGRPIVSTPLALPGPLVGHGPAEAGRRLPPEDSLRKRNKKVRTDDGQSPAVPTASGFCGSVRSALAEVEEDRGGQIGGVPTGPALRNLEERSHPGNQARVTYSL